MPNENLYSLDQIAPSLLACFGSHKLDLRRAPQIAITVREEDDLEEIDRHEILLSDGEKVKLWRVESLASLFRGDAKPPSLEKYPDKYIPCFVSIETQVASYAKLIEVPTDEQMREIYRSLHRFPDGKSRGQLHDHVWQGCALALGMGVWSKEQFTAVLQRLEKACRSFSLGVGSRNYLNTIIDRL